MTLKDKIFIGACTAYIVAVISNTGDGFMDISVFVSVFFTLLIAAFLTNND